ncbi:MAG TPA: hypothetical protein VK184_18685 [Nostocaceae cyanobacterium]|nr:hypothetical protein [Nostocaceae cyanobacterium]
MLKSLKSNWFWLFFATCCILFSFTVFSNWVVMVVIWFGLFFIFRWQNLEAKLSDSEHFIYLTTVLVYPLLGSWIKWMIEKNIIPYSWFWLNRLEHFSWALAVVILLLPLFIDIWKISNWWQNLILILGLVCLLGNINEFLEYFLRANSKTINYQLLAIYYQDTIYDMIMNIIGGFVAFLVLMWQIKR